MRLEGLGRVNLLVGTNNSGKTSLLECVGLLHSACDPHVLRSVLDARGEWLRDAAHGGVYDIVQLFPRRDMSERISVLGKRSGPGSQFGEVAAEMSVQAGWLQGEMQFDDESGEGMWDPPARLVWDSSERPRQFKAPLTADGAMPSRQLARHFWGADDATPRVRFVDTGGMVPGDVGDIFGDVVVTDAEESVVEAMRLIEPRVERLAVRSSRRASPGRGARSGIVLRIAGADGQVPIGSVGDGVWRMLGLALALEDARGGVLLVDEIDTGLHYTVMQKMWTMVAQRAESLDVQVFATTHSRDCYESLASVADPGAAPPGDLTIHRIEHDNGGSVVSFAEHEVAAVAERGLEVR